MCGDSDLLERKRSLAEMDVYCCIQSLFHIGTITSIIQRLPYSTIHSTCTYKKKLGHTAISCIALFRFPRRSTRRCWRPVGSVWSTGWSTSSPIGVRCPGRRRCRPSRWRTSRCAGAARAPGGRWSASRRRPAGGPARWRRHRCWA